MLSVLDQLWKDHLLGMDHLKEGIGLRGYGQKDPLVEYKRESFDMFEAMMQRFEEETGSFPLPDAGSRCRRSGARAPATGSVGRAGDSSRLRPMGAAETAIIPGSAGRKPIDDMEEAFHRKKKRELEQARMAGSGDAQQVQQVVRSGEKIGRNDPCPCGSGKKYKKCCGA